jgi:hypothetical protein
MSDMNQSGTALQSLVHRAGAVTIGLLFAVAAGSSVYCQNAGPDSPSVAAEAGDWRLAVTQPAPGGTTRPAALICYEITGTSREPVLVLEITPMWPGAGPAAETVRASATVGRSSVTADLSAAGQGSFDLRVKLLVDGSTQGPSVLLSGVTLRQDAAPSTCP